MTEEWNSGEEEPTTADRWNTRHSEGQKQMAGPVSRKGVDMTHSGAIKVMTGNTALLIEQNMTCPAQTQKDENGLERYWPAIKLGTYQAILNRTQMERLV